MRNVSHAVLTGLFLLLTQQVWSQTPIAVGGGSYASGVPADRLDDDGFYAPSPRTMLGQHSSLYMAPWLRSKPVPTNQWWTDLLIGQRGGNSNWFQQQFDGNGDAGRLWAYPTVVQPSRSGLNLYFPNRFLPNTSGNTVSPQGTFDLGPRLRIDHWTGVRLSPGDVLLADFGRPTYPANWTAAGDLVGTAPLPGGSWPGQSPPVTGVIGGGALNTYRGTDATQGSLSSPTFTIQTNFIDLKVAGGDDTVNTAVQLIVGGNVVRTAVGRRDATLRWTQWDVSSLRGQAARIVVKDSSQAGWGFIVCNYIVQTNNAADPATLFEETSTVNNIQVTGWSDWGLDFGQTDAKGANVSTTLARGVPFTWVRYAGVSPRLRIGAGVTLYGLSNSAITPVNGSFTASAFSFDLIDSNGEARSVGVYAPDNTTFRVIGDSVQAARPAYLVYAFLPSRSKLQEHSQYAYARVVNTMMSWFYNKGPQTATSLGGAVDTQWTLITSPLKGAELNTLQGFLPHHLRTTKRNFSTLATTYLTPRGQMTLAAGRSFSISFPFRGVIPTLPAPMASGLANDYRPDRMKTYLSRFAAGRPTNGADSYFQGKEFSLSSQYLAMAARTNEPASFFPLLAGLKKEIADWFTYTPGEAKNYFAWYPGWGSLVGFSSSFGSAGFNDHHFHYGYFAIASALIGMHDQSFLNRYGEMAKLVVKDYANWDRSDQRFPFLRCFDVWAGHSNAAGVSGPNGQNQESSSEAVNAWAGVFLLGQLLGDQAMGDTGAMGYAIESAATNEYWQDWKRTNFPAGYGKKSNGILTSSGNVYGTYFSGDPAWIYAIQWTSTNNWNTYLVRDKAHAALQLASMWQERKELSDWNIANNTGGFKIEGTNDAVGLGAYPGNYVLGFQALFDPAGVAAILDSAWSSNQALATDPSFAAPVYYLAHSLRTLGDPDETAYTSLPTSQVFINAQGQRTYVLYNPGVAARSCVVYINGAAAGSIVVGPRSFLATRTLGSFNRLEPYFGLPHPIPGTIEASDYDYGGQGLAYMESDIPNTGGHYRLNERVDIEASSGGGFNITNTAAGEWVRYTVNVAKTGPYLVRFRVAASAAGGSFRLLNSLGQNLAGAVAVPATGGSQSWRWIERTVNLTAGAHVLRVWVDGGGFNLNRMTFFATGAAATIPSGVEVSLKSSSTSQFVAAEDGGNQPLIANRGGASGWETFTLVDRGSGRISILAKANGKYVTLNASGQLIASSTTLAGGEVFTWIETGPGTVSLRSQTTGNLVFVPSSTESLTAGGLDYGSQTSFVVAPIVP